MRNQTSRRDFFARTSDGLLGAALAQLLCHDFFGTPLGLAGEPNSSVSSAPPAAAFDLKPKPTHHPAKAASVIQLFMNGGPSQIDLFDPKPLLNRMDGRP